MSARLDPAARAELLRIARRAIEGELSRERTSTPVAPASLPEPLRDRRGTFVTLLAPDPSRDGRLVLRGCIGDLDPEEPLPATTARCARQAAFADPRFPPMTPAEWPGVRLSVSVLTAPHEIAIEDEIEVGRHGVVLEKGVHRAVFLPHVGTEQRWDRATLLDRLARKAGLPGDGWRGGRLSVFEAESFGEDDGEPETDGPVVP